MLINNLLICIFKNIHQLYWLDLRKVCKQYNAVIKIMVSRLKTMDFKYCIENNLVENLKAGRVIDIINCKAELYRTAQIAYMMYQVCDESMFILGKPECLQYMINLYPQLVDQHTNTVVINNMQINPHMIRTKRFLTNLFQFGTDEYIFQILDNHVLLREWTDKLRFDMALSMAVKIYKKYGICKDAAVRAAVQLGDIKTLENIECKQEKIIDYSLTYKNISVFKHFYNPENMEWHFNTVIREHESAEFIIFMADSMDDISDIINKLLRVIIRNRAAKLFWTVKHKIKNENTQIILAVLSENRQWLAELQFDVFNVIKCLMMLKLDVTFMLGYASVWEKCQMYDSDDYVSIKHLIF